MFFNSHRRGSVRQWLLVGLVGVLWFDVGSADEGSFGPFTRDLSDTEWGYQLLLDPTGFAPTEEVERFEVRPGDCSRDGDRDDCADNRERSELTERARSRKPVTGPQWYRRLLYTSDAADDMQCGVDRGGGSR